MKVSEPTFRFRFHLRRGSIFIFLLLVVTALVCLPASVQAKAKKKQTADDNFSLHRFFSFDDAPYYTSPDKRIGVKILMDTAKIGATMAAMAHVTFLPGAHIKSHRHVFVTEVIYVLKGALTLRVGAETKVMGPDTTAYLPPRVFHEYLNDSTDVVQFLQYFSPPGPEEEYRTWERPDQPKVSTTASGAGADATTKNADEERNVVVPPLPVVPGSPVTTLGEPVVVDDHYVDLESSPREMGLTKPVLPATDQTNTPTPGTNLQLKSSTSNAAQSR